MSGAPRKVIHLPRVRMIRPQIRPGATIRITNVKSIRPPDPVLVRKQEEERLRAELQKEIVSRSKTCANKNYDCLVPVLSGRSYCAEHILQDSTAPYRACAHAPPSGERCNTPAPLSDHGLCFEHARAALLARQRAAAPPPPAASTETLLHQLQHYVRPERVRTASCASSVSVVSDPAEQDQATPLAGDPFKQLDATAINAQYSATLMECGSASDSDGDSVTVGLDCRVPAAGDPPSECELQPLWHAGVYTAEEAVSSALGTLRSLQQAYVRQAARLRLLLQQDRRNFLVQRRQEKEGYCSINTQARSAPLTVRERRQLRKLKAYASYHRKHGVDAVLARKLHRKRAALSGARPVAPPARCVHHECGARCPRPALPAARHCARHVPHDTRQVLYTFCGDASSGSACREALPRLPLPSATCRYHTRPPTYTVFTLKKDNSDSESESASSMAPSDYVGDSEMKSELDSMQPEFL